MLHLEYSLEKQEFQEFAYYANWLSPEQKDHRFKYYLANTFSYVFIVLFFAFAVRRNFEPFLFVVISVSLGIFLFLYTKSRIKSYPYQVAEDMILKEGGYDTILSRKELIISDTSLIIKNDLFESKFLWQAIKRKVEHNDCFYLYVGPRDAVIIPKRIFIDKGDLVKFQEYLLICLPLQADFPKSN